MDIDEGTHCGVAALASRSYQFEDTIVYVGDVAIGGESKVYIAGPCSVEDRDQIAEIARQIKGSAHILRGGAYKPWTSPTVFRVWERQAYVFLEKLAMKWDSCGDRSDVRSRSGYSGRRSGYAADRGPQHAEFCPAEESGSQRNLFSSSGVAATIEEFLLSAEYIMAAGNSQVVLCERGIRTFSNTFTRNTLDISAIPILKQLTHLPVVVDPSHGSGDWNLIEPLAKAALWPEPTDS